MTRFNRKPFNRKAFSAELALAKKQISQRDVDAAMHHLERAHLIGQAYVWPHVVSHWHFLRIEWQRNNAPAVVGQVARMLLGGVGSALGVVPTGNTGGSDISMFKRMPIDQAMQKILDGEEKDIA